MPLIIAGHTRSGTTMLMRIIHSHPQIALTREFGNFANVGFSYQDYRNYIFKRWYIVRGRWPFSISQRHNKLALIENFTFILRYLWGIRRYGSTQVTIKAIDASLKSIFPEAQIVGDKWPPYWLQLKNLAGLDDLKILFIYRDCRDVTSSFLQQTRTNWQDQKWWTAGKNNAGKIAAGWVQMINLMEENAGDLKIIRYEALVTNPQDIMESVGQWLDVDGHSFTTDGVQPASIGKYQSGLSAEELQAVMQVAGPTLARLGYN